MSDVTQIGGADPNFLWILLALPLGLGLDLAIGDLPGRGLPVRWLNRLIATIEDGVGRTVTRLGGGRGGALFGGLLLTFMVVGTVTGLVGLAVDLADRIQGPITLGVRALLIAGGLVVRATGDRILHAAEAPDRLVARDWLAAVGGRPPGRLDELGVDSVCVATLGESTSAAVVAPLFWLAVAGPAGMWGFLALRSLREVMQARGDRVDLAATVTIALADGAEAIPAVLSWGYLTTAALILRLDAARAWQAGWSAGRTWRRSVVVWSQATLAGALGVQIAGGRVFVAHPPGSNCRLGDPTHAPGSLDVIRGVRMMQITALLAGTTALIVSIFW